MDVHSFNHGIPFFSPLGHIHIHGWNLPNYLPPPIPRGLHEKGQAGQNLMGHSQHLVSEVSDWNTGLDVGE